MQGSPDYSKYDHLLVLGCFRGSLLKLASTGLPPDRTIFYMVGTDAYTMSKPGVISGIHRNLFMRYIERGARVVYVSEELRDLVGVDGPVLPIPVNTAMFRMPQFSKRNKDVLYYLGNGSSVYRPDWILGYARENPSEKITLCAVSEFETKLGNTVSVAQEEMPRLYHAHKKLIRMTSHDGAPKMIYEALLCGCEVIYNGRSISNVPVDMRMEHTIPRLIKYVDPFIEEKPAVKQVSEGMVTVPPNHLS